MRVLGIDFGERRIGIAVSDPDGRLAVARETIERVSDRQVIRRLLEIVREDEVEQVVIGEPRGLDGSRGEAAARVARFARKLRRTTALPCRLIDESLTSVEAKERLRQAGIDPRRSPERVDALAAQILLQEFLDGLAEGGGRG